MPKRKKVFDPFSSEFYFYHPDKDGDLLGYLRDHDGISTDNMFKGPRYFYVMLRRGLIIPDISWVRVGRSPAPDLAYFVNKDSQLESHGVGEANMSCMGAEEGVYDPREVLKKMYWSIKSLRLPEPKI